MTRLNDLSATFANWQTHRVTPEQAAKQIALDIAQRLQQALTLRDHAVLSVSGGKSPIALFEQLRIQPLGWSRIIVTLVDERCVPNSHEASNARLVREHLLANNASVAKFIPMVDDRYKTLSELAPTTELAHQAAETLDEVGVADVMVLGMGPDGHTASLFPDALQLASALDLQQSAACSPITLPTPPANAPFDRITQTLSRILQSRHLILPIAGEDKQQTLEHIVAQEPFLSGRSNPQALPVSYVLNQTQTPVSLWITT